MVVVDTNIYGRLTIALFEEDREVAAEVLIIILGKQGSHAFIIEGKILYETIEAELKEHFEEDLGVRLISDKLRNLSCRSASIDALD